ncbi:MAG: aldolase/citrate lyase family protein [Spirochaetia bacterium]|nr:aldolase/citrate lyase family protein [Spirochaetia bacterium]
MKDFINIKQKLKNNEPTVGTWMQIPDTSVAEIIGKSGYDWVALDLEHGLFSPCQLPDICRAIEIGGSVPFARISFNHFKEIKHALEAGVRGIIIPMISSAEELKEGINNALYPPNGNRGVGYSRANLFGRYFNQNVPAINREIIVVAQIENMNAVKSLDEILQVKGLDAIIVGPYDLSASMGITAEFENPDFIEIMRHIKSKAQTYQVPMGMHIVQPSPEELKLRIKEGYRFIAYSIDAVFLYKSALNPIKL